MAKCKRGEQCPIGEREYAPGEVIDGYCFWVCGARPDPTLPRVNQSINGEIVSSEYDPFNDERR